MSPEVVAGGLWESTGLSRLQALGKDSPAQRAEAAKQFEALLLTHLVQTMREAGEDGDDEGQKNEGALGGSQTYLEMADQALGLSLAERGGFGIARLIQKGLERKGVGQQGLERRGLEHILDKGSAVSADQQLEGKTVPTPPPATEGMKATDTTRASDSLRAK